LTTEQHDLPYNKLETAINTIETIFKCYTFYSTHMTPSYSYVTNIYNKYVMHICNKNLWWRYVFYTM